MSALAGSVRRLIDLTVTNQAPPEVLEVALERIDEAAKLLGAHIPSEPHARFVDPRSRGAGPAREVTEWNEEVMHQSMPYDPVIGHFNPLALPVAITIEPPLAIGTARFTTPYEGGPGWVHGAAIASAFDIVLTAANQITGSAGPTVWLTVRFRKPTLLDVESRFEAQVVSNDGRRVRSRGTLSQDGMVCAEAEGEFAVVSASRLMRR